MNMKPKMVGSLRLWRRGLVVPAMFFLALAATAGSAERLPASFGASIDSVANVERRVMPPVDVASLMAEDQLNDRRSRPGPTRFAAAIDVAYSLESSGSWADLEDGSHVWRLRIHSQDALSLNLGLTTFDLPHEARLWVYDMSGDQIAGPYSQRHRSPDGQLWLPVVLGDELVLELHLPAASDEARLVVGRVGHGYRFFGETEHKQGSCNIDVVCPEVDPYRDQVRAVARYTRSGIFLCTGNLMNNTAQDFRPFFLTADHCGINASNASSVVVYWNYESPSCGQLSGGSLGDTQTGATFRASSPLSDFALVELNQMPDPSSSVFYAGWDAGGAIPQSVVGIHHPQGDEKAAAFEGDPLTSTDIGTGGGESHWEVSAWDVGTTEPGSSGSCIFDQTSKACVGHLTGGFASCANPTGLDVYGKFSLAWSGAGTASSRLSNWLDPIGGGATTALGGADPATSGGTCVSDPETLCLGNGRFEVKVLWTDFVGQSGNAQVVPGGTADSSNLWFFSANNWELLIKVLDGCAFNDRYWVFFAATTNVEFTVTVTDTLADTSKQYFNPLGQAANAVTDTSAFDTCSVGSTAAPLTGSANRIPVLDEGSSSAVLELGFATTAQSSAQLDSGGPRLEASSPRGPAGLRSAGKAKGLTDKTLILPQKACVINSLTCNSSVTGVLTPDDCDLDDGTRIDFWEFSGSSGSTVTIDAMSSEFDTFLFLFDPTPELFAVDDDSGSGTNSRIVSTLDAGGTWSIGVNGFGPSDLGNYTLTLACGGGPSSPPSAPTNLTATPMSSDSIQLLWQDNSSNEAEFRVEMRAPGGGFADIGAVAANSAGANVSGLLPDTTYDFRVRARNAAGDSGYSNVTSATTLAEGVCTPADTTLCLNNDRFKIEVEWDTGSGTGAGQVVPGGTGDSSNLWFFSDNNWEMLIKVLDGCAFNNNYWVFFAATTDVGFTVTVTDTQEDEVKVYTSPLGQAANAVTDTAAFATCP